MAKPTDGEAEGKSDEKILAKARKDWERCREYWSDHRAQATDDYRFARLEEQWPEKVKKVREDENRPCETFNKLPSFIRQVVNDARQNKPAIKVHPADSGADVKTADVINGLIRNIEVTSDADTAYDTAAEHAVDRGLGYFRINVKYAYDDTFDRDIVFERVNNPLAVYGDPNSTAADSSDWNVAFVATVMPKDDFESEYPNADAVDWDADEMQGWRDGDNIIVAEYWTREKVARMLVSAGGQAMFQDDFDRRVAEGEPLTLDEGVQPEERPTYKVTQRILTGNQVLKTVAWPGKYIPIIPVYGDEVTDEDGKRHYISLIRPAKGAQRMYNYMRNTSIELVALAPKAPFVGEERAFGLDPHWNSANDVSHPYLMVPDGVPPPQRQPYVGVPAGVIQETMSANDDMKAIMGIYDASLGNKSNETSGKAIRARQMEGDTATFHFMDNLSRAIRHGGRVLIDLIPKVYSTKRVIRVLGEDLKPQNVQLDPMGQAVAPMQGPDGEITGHIYDITAGKYDLTVKAGPSFGTRREEAREEIVEIIRNVPDSATILGPMYLRNSDWPGAEEAAAKLESGAEGAQVPPEVMQQMQEMQQVIQQGGQELQRLQGELAAAKADQQGKQAEIGLKQQEMALQVQIKQAELAIKEKEFAIKAAELEIKRFEAETDRIQAMKPEPEPPAQEAA